MSPYSGGPAMPFTSGGSFASMASAVRSNTSARMSSSNGGPTMSGVMPIAFAPRASVASSSGAAASGSHVAGSIVVVNAAPDAPMTQSYSLAVAVARLAGNVQSRPSPKRSEGMSLRTRLRDTTDVLAVLVGRERVLEEREDLQRDPLRRVDARSHAIRVRRAAGPAPAV